MNNEKEIYFLWDYTWEKAILLKECHKNNKLLVDIPGCQKHTKYVPKEKCALPDEKVCIVWETWKGKNGRGGYRVEREKYENFRIPAKNIDRSHYYDNKYGRVLEKNK